MKTLPTILTCFPCAMLLAAECPSTQTSTGTAWEPSQNEIVEYLRSQKVSDHADIARRLRWQRKQLLIGLWRVIERGVTQPDQADAVRTAMGVLGEMRATEAVPLLVENIGFTFGQVGMGVSPSSAGPFLDMPAVWPLVQIGLPSVDALVKKVAEKDDDVLRKRAAIVINQVLGTSFAIAYLKDRREGEKDGAKRERLDRLIEQVDTAERKRRRHEGDM